MKKTFDLMQCKTKGEEKPEGLSRLYFCCHKDDFETYFESITETMLELKEHAAVWYRDPSEPFKVTGQFLNELRKMQLLIIPVTKKFLYEEHPARDTELTFAIFHHIPVLPLMQEEGLEAAFNRVCITIEYMRKQLSFSEAAALPYEDRFRGFLDSFLINDKQAVRICKAVDACIFLCYWKMEQPEALKIVPLIQDNEFCREIDFGHGDPLLSDYDKIKMIVKKSNLFTLIGAPSVLYDPTYRLTTECLAAVNGRGEILPEALQDPDVDMLKEMYQGIRSCFMVKDPATIESLLHDLLLDIALQGNSDDPTHCYLVGLAYQYGIEVTEDSERAVGLFMNAAAAGLEEAYRKLFMMYQDGDGVDQSYPEAIKWQKKYIEYLQQCEETGCQDLSGKLFSAFWDLGDCQKEAEQYAEAKESYLNMLDYAEKMNGIIETMAWYTLSITYDHLVDICIRENELSEAKDWLEKRLELAESIYDTIGTVDSKQDIGIIYMRLGDLCVADDKMDEARSWYEKEREIAELIVSETDAFRDRQGLAFSYSNLGELCEAEGDLSAAENWYEKGMQVSKTIYEETGTEDDKLILVSFYHILSEVCEAEGKKEEADRWLAEALALS